MDNDVTDVTEPVRDDPVAAPVPWFRRRSTIAGGAAAALLLALIGGLTWMFAGEKTTPDAALKPIVPSSSPAPEPESADLPLSDATGGLDLIGGLGDSSALDTAGATSSADTSMFSTPGAAGSVGGLPAFQLPPPPQGFQPPAPVDWEALLQPWIEAQREAVAAGLGGAIGGPVVGAAWGTANTAAIIVGDLILFAAANNNGGALLNQLQAALPALTAPAAAAGVGAPDFSGLSAAFAAAAGTPPLGVPVLPQLPALPPPPAGLPTPEQVVAGLAALPAVGLPALPPPPIGLPTPEQVAGGLFALPAIGLPALPPLPPPPSLGFPTIGFPTIGFPPIGLPSIGLPSITRLLGLPF